MLDPLLTNYRVLADQRLHFGRLYWQCVAFLFVLLSALFVILPDSGFASFPDTMFAGGILCIVMGYVTHRLRLLESQYEIRLGNIERALQAKGHESIQIAPVSGPFGARFVIVMGLFGLGVLLIALSLFLRPA